MEKNSVDFGHKNLNLTSVYLKTIVKLAYMQFNAHNKIYL